MQPEPLKYDAFLSYARVDDESLAGEMGSVSKFHAALELELRTLWKRDCRIFIDREIQSGARWRKVLDERLNEVNFLVAMLSPSFFESEMCRGEVMAFVEGARARGREAMVFPVLVQDVGHVARDEFYSEMMARQNVSFIKLKFKTPSSEAFREFIAEFASDVLNTIRASAVGHAPTSPALTNGNAQGSVGGKTAKPTEEFGGTASQLAAAAAEVVHVAMANAEPDEASESGMLPSETDIQTPTTVESDLPTLRTVDGPLASYLDPEARKRSLMVMLGLIVLLLVGFAWWAASHGKTDNEPTSRPSIPNVDSSLTGETTGK